MSKEGTAAVIGRYKEEPWGIMYVCWPGADDCNVWGANELYAFGGAAPLDMCLSLMGYPILPALTF